MSVVKSEWSRFGTCKGVGEAPPKPAPLPCKPHAYWAESDDEFAHVGSGSESDDDREKIKRADAADQWDGSYLHHDRDLPSYTVVEEDNEDDVYGSDSSQSDGESSDAEEEKEVTAKVMEKGKARSIEASIVTKTVRNNEGSSGEETDESDDGYASNDGYESDSDDGYIPAPRTRRRRVRNVIEISDDTENEEYWVLSYQRHHLLLPGPPGRTEPCLNGLAHPSLDYTERSPMASSGKTRPSTAKCPRQLVPLLGSARLQQCHLDQDNQLGRQETQAV